MKIEYQQNRPEVNVSMEIAIDCAECGETLEAELEEYPRAGTLWLHVQHCKPCRTKAEDAATKQAEDVTKE